MYTNLDIINQCDKFPYPETDPEGYAAIMKDLYTLVWKGPDGDVPIGYVRESVFERLVKVPIAIKGEMEVNRPQRLVYIFPQATEAARSVAAAGTAGFWRDNQTFKVLAGWRNELYPVYGPNHELLWNVERSASSLLGILTYGIHMTAYTRCADASYGIKIWVPRRSYKKQTYPGMLDNSVAGGMATGEDIFECAVREANEEASLPEDLVRAHAKAAGTITYIHITSAKMGGETGLIQPECEYIYDLELPADVTPKPNDNEVEEFYLWTVEECQQHLALGEFKPNCGIVMVDFFLRHGILTRDNEKDYDEIMRRTRRDIPFPGLHKA